MTNKNSTQRQSFPSENFSRPSTKSIDRIIRENFYLYESTIDDFLHVRDAPLVVYSIGLIPVIFFSSPQNKEKLFILFFFPFSSNTEITFNFKNKLKSLRVNFLPITCSTNYLNSFSKVDKTLFLLISFHGRRSPTI